MNRSLPWTLALTLVSAAIATPASAQLDPWTISIEAEGGGFFPVRAFGKNTTRTPEEDLDLVAFQPSAKAESMAMFGGGIRVQMPNPSLSLRLSGYTTPDGDVELRSPACDVLDPANPGDQDLFDDLRCATHFSETYRVSQLMARVQFKNVGDGQALRPTVDIGLGARRFDFSGVEPSVCNALVLTREAFYICDKADELTVDQTQPFLMFGLGVEYVTERANFFIRVNDQVTSYGGSSRGEQEAQNDVYLSAGMAFHVR